uniref:Nucleoside-diphosphate-sugar epimerase n=1 Tax=Candidatus Kentrum eta TaxID=2126337 RepID=A0A450V0Z6_9GAMM|nr:MAG: Nucleoside-diphosphate-sugar epimerase [Candidatus Kentron sp. H]VFJ91803.1 MAG: Nucleoside-diphosphate-sugar epimerase [Candidatus Kentron sp. H]VFJ98451.1 MAG: Nucleoside-diphosphate-sugar epimerase [Candidatus Kentron sp. H]
MNILITGGTSLLGRNFLFEAFRAYEKGENIKLFLLGRSSGDQTFKQRVISILSDECPVSLRDALSDILVYFNDDEFVNYFEYDLGEDELFDVSTRAQIMRIRFSHFLHIASVSDFRADEVVVRKLNQVNVKGTDQMLTLCKDLNAKKFIYVSSAYVCGETFGEISPDYVNLEASFRNSYERTKLQAEVNVRQFCKENRINYLIYRPSIVSGRLIEPVLGLTYKFDIFYSCAALLLYAKNVIHSDLSIEELLEIHLNIPMRAYYSNDSGLNIVPVDYVAKVMMHTILEDIYNRSIHLVNDEETPHSLYIPLIEKAVNCSGVIRVDGDPSNKTIIEKMYYRSFGKMFTPYITGKPMLFDKSNIEYVRLNCPKVDEERFNTLMEYAKSRKFGLSRSPDEADIVTMPEPPLSAIKAMAYRLGFKVKNLFDKRVLLDSEGK